MTDDTNRKAFAKTTNASTLPLLFKQATGVSLDENSLRNQAGRQMQLPELTKYHCAVHYGDWRVRHWLSAPRDSEVH